GKVKAWNKDTLEITDLHGRVQKIPLAYDPAIAIDGQVVVAVIRGKDGKPSPISLVRDQKIAKKAMAPGAAVAVVYEPDRFARTYWQQDGEKGDAGAQQAFLKLTEQQASGKNSDVRDDDVLKRLVHLNIESATCRYAPDLKAYWANATSDSNVKENMLHTLPAQDRADGKPNGEPTPPEGAGWVVELRGYTWSDREPYQFLRTVFINKLAADASKKDDDKSKDADKDHPDPTDIHTAWKRAIEGDVNHAFVYKAIPYQNADPNQFNLINTSVLDSLLGGGGAAPTGGRGAQEQMMGMMANKGGGSGGTGSFTSLLDAAGTGGGTGGGKQPPMVSGAPRLPNLPNGKSPPGSAEADKSAENAKPGATRTEFIVLFIWKEPGKDRTPAPTTPQ
ncbi:MAG TPA: hypothetical protein VFA18_22650, partial [Gemmataceae bacterium]|nr:hypothetical protein [Gemmataceae bacterium]